MSNSLECWCKPGRARNLGLLLACSFILGAVLFVNSIAPLNKHLGAVTLLAVILIFVGIIYMSLTWIDNHSVRLDPKTIFIFPNKTIEIAKKTTVWTHRLRRVLSGALLAGNYEEQVSSTVNSLKYYDPAYRADHNTSWFFPNKCINIRLKTRVSGSPERLRRLRDAYLPNETDLLQLNWDGVYKLYGRARDEVWLACRQIVLANNINAEKITADAGKWSEFILERLRLLFDDPASCIIVDEVELKVVDLDEFGNEAKKA